MKTTIFEMLLAVGLAAILILPVGCTKEVETTTQSVQTTSVQTFPRETTLAEAQRVIGVDIPTPRYRLLAERCHARQPERSIDWLSCLGRR